MAALTGGKGFPFLFQHIRDGINIRQTCNLIFSLCRYNNRLAEHVSVSGWVLSALLASGSRLLILADLLQIVSMLFTSIAKLTPEVRTTAVATLKLLPLWS